MVWKAVNMSMKERPKNMTLRSLTRLVERTVDGIIEVLRMPDKRLRKDRLKWAKANTITTRETLH